MTALERLIVDEYNKHTSTFHFHRVIHCIKVYRAHDYSTLSFAKNTVEHILTKYNQKKLISRVNNVGCMMPLT